MAINIQENKELIEFKSDESKAKDIAIHKNFITEIKLQNDGFITVFSTTHDNLSFSLGDVASPNFNSPSQLRNHLWNLWGASNQNHHYSAAIFLDIHYVSGDSEVTVDINSNSEGIYYIIDDKSNTGSPITFEADFGNGFITVELPITLSDGNVLKVKRPDNSSDGYVIIKGSYK